MKYNIFCHVLSYRVFVKDYTFMSEQFVITRFQLEDWFQLVEFLTHSVYIDIVLS
jgi:hypothetical protein